MRGISLTPTDDVQLELNRFAPGETLRWRIEKYVEFRRFEAVGFQPGPYTRQRLSFNEANRILDNRSFQPLRIVPKPRHLRKQQPFGDEGVVVKVLEENGELEFVNGHGGSIYYADVRQIRSA